MTPRMVGPLAGCKSEASQGSRTPVTLNLKRLLNRHYHLQHGIYTDSKVQGYWSHLTKTEQALLLSEIKTHTCRNVVRKSLPNLESYMFSPVRATGLKVLGIRPNDIGIDYGCMWGNLLLHAAKHCEAIVGIDQTRESLLFLRKRVVEENLHHKCFLVHANLRNDIKLHRIFDFAVINGVLEWVPDSSEFTRAPIFRGRLSLKKPLREPRLSQLEFLRMVHRNLKTGGKLYLAIENRYDYQFFLWKLDPHTKTLYTPFLPRGIANFLSNVWRNRPYANYLYSHDALENILREAGFRTITKYAVFPTYKYPRTIISLDSRNLDQYQPFYNSAETKNPVKISFRKIRLFLDMLIYKRLGLLELAPSFIVIATRSKGD